MSRSCNPKQVYQYVALPDEPSLTKIDELQDMLKDSEATMYLRYDGSGTHLTSVGLEYEDGDFVVLPIKTAFVRTPDGSILTMSHEEFAEDYTIA